MVNVGLGKGGPRAYARVETAVRVVGVLPCAGGGRERGSGQGGCVERAGLAGYGEGCGGAVGGDDAAQDGLIIETGDHVGEGGGLCGGQGGEDGKGGEGVHVDGGLLCL